MIQNYVLIRGALNKENLEVINSNPSLNEKELKEISENLIQKIPDFIFSTKEPRTLLLEDTRGYNILKVFNEDDVRMAECRVKLIQAGLTPELGFHVSIAKIYKELVEKLVEKESKILLRLLTGKLDTEEIAGILETITPVVNTMIQIMHNKEIKNMTKRYAQNPEGEGAI